MIREDDAWTSCRKARAIERSPGITRARRRRDRSRHTNGARARPSAVKDTPDSTSPPARTSSPTSSTGCHEPCRLSSVRVGWPAHGLWRPRTGCGAGTRVAAPARASWGLRTGCGAAYGCGGGRHTGRGAGTRVGEAVHALELVCGVGNPCAGAATCVWARSPGARCRFSAGAGGARGAVLTDTQRGYARTRVRTVCRYTRFVCRAPMVCAATPARVPRARVVCDVPAVWPRTHAVCRATDRVRARRWSGGGSRLRSARFQVARISFGHGPRSPELISPAAADVTWPGPSGRVGSPCSWPGRGASLLQRRVIRFSPALPAASISATWNAVCASTRSASRRCAGSAVISLSRSPARRQSRPCSTITRRPRARAGCGRRQSAHVGGPSAPAPPAASR